MPENKKPLVLAVLDGWGISSKNIGNPILQAKKPVMDQIAAEFPATALQASGLAVGMSWEESGNSEVGHLSIGAGRIVRQYYARILKSIEDRSFSENQALKGAFERAEKNGSYLHIAGLLTSGTVHAAFKHLVGLLDMAAAKNFSRIYLHLFLDGRDSGLREGIDLLRKIDAEIKVRKAGSIASVIGRDFAMDRNEDWSLTKKTYELMVQGRGEQGEIFQLISKHYQAGESDPKMPPLVNSASGFSGIKDSDALIFFNFREDSMRQITRTFIEKEFAVFPRSVQYQNLYVCAMTEYLQNENLRVAFLPPVINNCLAEVLSKSGLSQMHIAETEKYAHVTYFFNGLKNEALTGETDIFIPSVEDLLAKPQMASLEIVSKVNQELDRGFFDFTVLNLANADLLSHTGNFQATLTGVEAVDKAIGLLKNKVLEKNGILIITADHGHAEDMIYASTGESKTKHNSNPIPFYLVAEKFRRPQKTEKIPIDKPEINGILADIAPTILDLMSVPQPAEMTGQSLLNILS